MLVDNGACRPDSKGGRRFARDESGYAEIEEVGCFSSISSSDDDPSISNSVPEDASGRKDCDIRFAAEFALL
jgi:hypothetical protein